MSDRSDSAKLESILEFINHIEIIISRYSSIEEALLDIEGQYALLMCIQQIGEALNAIISENLRAKLPVKDAVGFRNIIVHNYDGINFAIVEMTLKLKIPELKATILSIMEKNGIGKG